MIEKSKCPSCSNTEFESVIQKPLKSDYDLQFIRCTSCKAVVGVIDHYNIGTLVNKLALKLNIDMNN